MKCERCPNAEGLVKLGKNRQGGDRLICPDCNRARRNARISRPSMKIDYDWARKAREINGRIMNKYACR
jgi:transposase-like protein